MRKATTVSESVTENVDGDMDITREWRGHINIDDHVGLYQNDAVMHILAVYGNGWCYIRAEHSKHY